MSEFNIFLNHSYIMMNRHTEGGIDLVRGRYGEGTREDLPILLLNYNNYLNRDFKDCENWLM